VAKLFSRDEARGIAANLTKLLERLLGMRSASLARDQRALAFSS
jgi:hypothetical protein